MQPPDIPRGDFFEFGPFLIDVSKRSLFRDGEFVPLTPKVFDILLVLVEESGRVVTKTELLERVWPNAFVEEGSITQNISVLRKILDPYFGGQTPIATIPRRGYRFTASVRLRNREAGVILAEPGVAPVPATAKKLWLGAAFAMVVLVAAILALRVGTHTDGGLRKPMRRSVAVLTLQDLAGQPGSAWLSTALAETLTTELASSPGLRLIASQNIATMRHELALPATASLTAKALDDLRKNLACDLVLAGAYLPVNGRIRLDVKLIDTRSAETIAAVTQTDDEKNLLDLVARTGVSLREKLGIQSAETQGPGVRAAVSANQEARRLYFDGLSRLHEHDGPEAQKLLSKAAAVDPDFALAHSALSAAWRQLGYDNNARDEARKAFELSARLSREDRLAVEAQYYEASSNCPKASETNRSLWRFFPDNIDYALQLASNEFFLNRPEEMLRIVDELRSLPGPSSRDPRIDLLEATAAHLLSDYRRALNAAGRAAQEALSRKALFLLANARVKQGTNTDFLGAAGKAREYYAEAIRLYESLGDPGQAAYARRLDAEILVRQGRFDLAEQEFAQSLTETRRMGYVRMTARVLLGYGNLLRQRGRLTSARKMLEESLALTRQTEDKAILINLLNGLGQVMRLTGESAAARAHFQESLRVSRAAGNRAGVSESLTNLATLDTAAGNLPAARAGLDESISLKRQLGNHSSLAASLGHLGRVQRMQGDQAGARKTVEEQCRLLELVNEKRPRALVLCRLDLAEMSLDTVKASDIRVAMERIDADYALLASSPAALNQIVRLRLSAGEPAKARAAVAQARKEMREGDYIPEVAIPLAITSARIDQAEGQTARAVEVLAGTQAEAQKFNLVPLVLECRLALAEIRTLRSRDNTLASLANDAERSGFGLIAARARTQKR